MRPDIPGVSLTALHQWMDENGLGSGPITASSLITGGTQNILLRFRRSGREYVLRRPPVHKRDNSDETLRREAQVLSELATTDVPHPRLIAACGDSDPLGAAFYLMEPVDGVSPTVSWDQTFRTDPEAQRHLGFAMVTALAALGRVDVSRPGLSGLGRPAAGWLERQTPRWRRQLESYQRLENYPGHGLPGVGVVASWLDENRPPQWSPGLIHGDYHFSNVMVDPASGDVTAIVDWELATVGDPLLDLGHLLATWPSHYPIGGGIEASHLPDTGSLIEWYDELSGRDVGYVRWYQALACFRLGIILEGSHARAHAGLAPEETGRRLHHNVVVLFEQALRLIEG